MTSLLQPPVAKPRSRKGSSASSIPTLMSLEEENNYSPPRLTVNGNGNDARKYSDSCLPSTTAFTDLSVTQKPTKASRRSSLSLGLLGGKNDSNKSGKRRSSIAVVFLGRRNSKVCNKITENWTQIGHFDAWWFNTKHFVISQSKEPAIEKVERYQKSSESDTENDPPVTITITSADGDATTHDKKRRRSSSWATKMERRRRKGLPAMSGEIDYNGTTNGQYDAYARQKRHSWWNIFVPENLKNR